MDACIDNGLDNDMTWVDGKGHLILSSEYDETGELIMGAVRTRDLFEQTYGYFEIRCKLQQVPGFWSAFWLMPRNIDMYGQDGGQDGTEIDIYEAFDVSVKYHPGWLKYPQISVEYYLDSDGYVKKKDVLQLKDDLDKIDDIETREYMEYLIKNIENKDLNQGRRRS